MGPPLDPLCDWLQTEWYGDSVDPSIHGVEGGGQAQAAEEGVAGEWKGVSVVRVVAVAGDELDRREQYPTVLP